MSAFILSLYSNFLECAVIYFPKFIKRNSFAADAKGM